MKLTKVKCGRCGGSGKYSFNLIHGNKCYGCNGTGFQMVDAAKEEKRSIRASEKKLKDARMAARRAELADEFHTKFKAEFGIAGDDTKASYELVCAVQRKYGKTPGEFVKTELEKEFGK